MATTEAGGGVPSGELRERIARLIEPYYWHDGLDALVADNPASTPAIARDASLVMAEEIVAEIAAAGFELVPTDRMSRLRAVAVIGQAECTNDTSYHPGAEEWWCLEQYGVEPLQAGDLDRPEGA